LYKLYEVEVIQMDSISSILSMDDKVDGPNKLGGFLKGTFYTLSLFALLNLTTLKETKAQGDPALRNLTVQVQLFKSDSSNFGFQEAGINVEGNDINDSTNSIIYGVDWVNSSGYVEFNFDLWTPGPNSVEDYITTVPDGYRMGAFPNPYNPTTNFVFEIPKSGNFDVNLYNILGEELAGWKHSKFLNKGEYQVNLGGGAVGVQFARVNGDGYSKTWKLVNLGGASIAYVDENFSNSDYFSSITSKLPKGGSVDGTEEEIVSDKIAIQWVVPGFGTDYVWRNLFENGEFQDTIYQEFLLPYPSSAPGVKFYPEGESTITIDNYFQSNQEFNFNYKNDVKKD